MTSNFIMIEMKISPAGNPLLFSMQTQYNTYNDYMIGHHDS
ncbi:MAG: hypothetical protein ACLRQF_00800 [Thomasclavelia ramosa]